MKCRMSPKQLERANEASSGCYLYQRMSGWTRAKLRDKHLELKTTACPCLSAIRRLLFLLLSIKTYFAILGMKMTGEKLHR